jgi:hypothetical protein
VKEEQYSAKAESATITKKQPWKLETIKTLVVFPASPEHYCPKDLTLKSKQNLSQI